MSTPFQSGNKWGIKFHDVKRVFKKKGSDVARRINAFVSHHAPLFTVTMVEEKPHFTRLETKKTRLDKVINFVEKESAMRQINDWAEQLIANGYEEVEQ